MWTEEGARKKKVSTNSRNTVAVAVRDHPYITSAKGLGGWVLKMVIFADVQYCIYADIMGGWVGQTKSLNMLT